jgi:hypothetical protein
MKKKPMSEKGQKAVSDFERKYNSELYDESALSGGGRVSDNPPNGPYKNTYGDQFPKKASSKAPEYHDPAREAVRTFRKSYTRDTD